MFKVSFISMNEIKSGFNMLHLKKIKTLEEEDTTTTYCTAVL